MTNEELVQQIRIGNNVDYHLSELYKQNLPMIRKQALHYLTDEQELDDLQQEAFFGLRTAALKYDPDSGFKFLTYALFWIRQSIGRYVQNSSHAIRFPVHLQEKLPAYQQFIEEYKEQNQKPPDRKAISKALQLKENTVQALEKYDQMTKMKSLDEPIIYKDSNDMTLAEILPDDRCLEDDSVDVVLKEDLEKLIGAILGDIKEKWRNILVETVMNDKTLEETGQKYGVSKERIRQIRQKAIKEIKKNPKFRRLQNLAFDLYGESLRGTGRKVFERTFTSATERTVMMDLRRQKDIRTILDQICSCPDLNRTMLRDLLQELEPDVAKALIQATVAGNDNQSVLILKFIKQQTYEQIFPNVCRQTGFRRTNLILDEMVRSLQSMHAEQGRESTETAPAGECSSKE